MEKHYSLKKAAELLGVTTQTLRNWDNSGKIYTIRTPGNQRRIPENEIIRLVGPKVDIEKKIEYKPKRSTVEKQESFEPTSFVLVNKDNLILMCRDSEVYDITNDEVLHEGLLPGCMLKETKSYLQWMETRYSKDTNFSSQRLMQSAFGSLGHEHAKAETGALSLSDCYWVKRQGEDVKYADITPYLQFNPLANLFVSGKTDKRWLDALTLLKVDSFWEIDPYNLCMALGLSNVPEAKITDEGIVLHNFTSTDHFFESMEQSGITLEDDPRDKAVRTFKENAVTLFIIDYLVENNDRHPDDYGYLRDSNTGEYISMAPYHNFDWVWSGEAVALPDSAWQEHRGYIRDLCMQAKSVAGNFEYGTIIERRADELLRL